MRWITSLLPIRRPLPEPCAFPPPYRRMVAINSDVEWTTCRSQLDLLEAFANRSLELALSFWLFTRPGGTWSLFGDRTQDPVLSPEGEAFAREGLLDTLHSIGGQRHRGGVVFTRAEIENGYRVMHAAGIRPLVYSNHGGEYDTQNIGGGWASYQLGDLPGSDVYHLDLTRQLGIRYFWCDPDYSTEQTSLRPGIDEEDTLFVSGQARDGTPLLRFRRFLGRLPTGPSLDNLGEQLKQVLTSGKEGYTVVYQHLGVERLADGRPGFARTNPIREDALEALDAMSKAQQRGEILVTGTARLLQYAALMSARPWHIYWKEPQQLIVEFKHTMELGGQRLPVSWESLEGWTLPVPEGTRVTACLCGEQRHLEPVDKKEGHILIGFPWRRRNMRKVVRQLQKSLHCGQEGWSYPASVDSSTFGV